MPLIDNVQGGREKDDDEGSTSHFSLVAHVVDLTLRKQYCYEKKLNGEINECISSKEFLVRIIQLAKRADKRRRRRRQHETTTTLRGESEKKKTLICRFSDNVVKSTLQAR